MDNKIFIQKVFSLKILMKYFSKKHALKIIKPDKKCTGFVIWMG